jgi:hypothetical protein
MPKTTELVSLLKDRHDDPRYAVCYARGSIFKKEGNFWRVERGRRTVVRRDLCATSHFGRRCKICPNHEFELTVKRGAG